MNYADRGKSAEAQVKAALKVLETQNVASYRWPDARGGATAVAPADFITLRKGTMILYEVKEVAHDFRLPHGNMGRDQVARMRLWEYAGAKSFILIRHSTSKLWRFGPVDWFLKREGGSWDLRSLPTYDELSTLLDFLFGEIE